MAQKMTVDQFVAKWGKIQLKEKSASQSHFNDVCALVGHATPTEVDPTGQFFTFEAPTLPSPKLDEPQSNLGEVAEGRRGSGWADAWYKGKFIWEYKGHRKQDQNLDAAYQQLLRYREFLGNPPLLITSDLQQIIIHTNFNNTARRVEVIDFERLRKDGLQLLHDAFYNPEAFRPAETQEKVTEKTAASFVTFTQTLQKWGNKTYHPERLAHFVVRILFCLFAEDIGLLPDKVFTDLVKHRYKDQTAEQFTKSLRILFAAMREGNSMFGAHIIPWFNGGLFDDDFVPDLPGGSLHELLAACGNDWAGIDPSIFGTLFERIIDENKRAQLGLHYTSKDDILLVIEPVLMAPLRAKWRKVQADVLHVLAQADVAASERSPASAAAPDPAGNSVKQEIASGLRLQRTERASAQPLATTAAWELLKAFSDELVALKVLDPACGSGNFLYMALRELLDLQKKVIIFAEEHGLPEIPLTVNPQQLYGIEVNPYAHQLAQITVWIGYIQWRYENGFAELQEPILRQLEGIQNRDAILTPSGLRPPPPNTDEPQSVFGGGQGGGEPAWPPADVIVGNPPFLGGNKIRAELGDAYVEALFKLYAGRVPAFADLVCYWFEKARAQIESGQLKRAGLLATNSIRGGVNRKVLERIKETGDIFWAQSDRDWVLNGAAVRISMIGFDDGIQQEKILDDLITPNINPDLTNSYNLTEAKYLAENAGLCFEGTKKTGSFEIEESIAKAMISATNKSSLSNSDVVKPTANGIDLTSGNRGMWIIDFGVDTTIQDAKQYEKPFEYVEKYVKPEREKSRERNLVENWWLFERPRPEMRDALRSLNRFVVTPKTSKHRIFTWLQHPTLPDQALTVIAREDDYFFGVLHSKAHEIWVLRKGTSLEDRPRYSLTATFETYPFPWPPGKEPGDSALVQAIAAAAKRLDDFRNAWLHPNNTLLQGSKEQGKRTLTNLYNGLALYREKIRGKPRSESAWKAALREIFRTEKLAVELILSLDEVETLDEIHTELDRAVLDAYGWPHSLSDEQILERLLALNLERASA